MDFIDLRSDTVTWPTPAMRKAMAGASVGDDVYRDDPMVNELEALAAELTGKEAALFVPSGTFGNQLALFSWCPRGSEVILGEQCHIIQHEAGAASVIAGVQTRPIDAPDGRLRPADLASRIRGQDIHYPPTSLICMENAHSSGRVVALEAMREVARFAKAHGLPVHLDGARIFNAALFLGVPASDIAACVDSVMFCLSKGLCAPVGSMLAGPADFIGEARRKRKIMGGGMRQAGVLAAAGLIALREMRLRLGEDHENARYLADKLAELPGFRVERETCDINMVFFRAPAWLDGAALAASLAAERVRISPPEKAPETAAPGLRERGPAASPETAAKTEPLGGYFRFVTHYWIKKRHIDKTVALVAAFAAAQRPAAQRPAARKSAAARHSAKSRRAKADGAKADGAKARRATPHSARSRKA